MHGFTPRAVLVGAVLSLSLIVPSPLAAAPPGGSYTVTPLVSDVAGAAPVRDPNLVNGWGLSRGPATPWWVSDNGTDKSTLYTATGSIVPLVVAVGGGPTGTVFAGSTGAFPVATDTSPTVAAARFLFASEDGQIRAWRGGGTALVTVPNSSGAIYKGLAIAPDSPLLYAADFHNARVEMFNGAWQNVTPPGAFSDPMLPAGYAPFGIQTIGQRVYVSYAKQDADAADEVAGVGRGFVDAYTLDGTLLERVAQHGQLNAPWGLALAPSTFGRYAGDLLVGNFGNGQINAYQDTPAGFRHRGTLRDTSDNKLAIDGLWALEFGNSGSNGSPDTLFFTAGPSDESHGLFGTITPG